MTRNARGSPFNDPINHTDPSGFSADVDVGGGIVGGIVGAGHLAAPALMAAGLGANLETAAIGGVAGGINIGVSALLGFPGAGSAPKTFTTPGGTHAPGAVGGAGSNALAQHSEIPQGSAKGQEGRPPGLCEWSGACLAMKLPNDPTGLPPEWAQDATHLDPNGTRWRHPSGDYLDFHKAQPGKPGWRGKDHWHHNGEKPHLKPGTDVPDPEEISREAVQSDGVVQDADEPESMKRMPMRRHDASTPANPWRPVVPYLPLFLIPLLAPLAI